MTRHLPRCRLGAPWGLLVPSIWARACCLSHPLKISVRGQASADPTGRNPIEHGRVMRSRWWNQPEHQPFRVTNFARPPRHGGSCAEPLAAKSLPVHPGPAGCSFPDGPEPGLRLSAGGQHQQAGRPSDSDVVLAGPFKASEETLELPGMGL